MGDKFIAETQYNDVVGTAAFDGHDHPPLHELAEHTNMPKDKYCCVGFELYELSPTQGEEIQFNIVAVNCKEAGVQDIRDIDQIAKGAELPVYRFFGRLKPEDFSVLFKRIDIKVVHKDLKSLNIVPHDPSSDLMS